MVDIMLKLVPKYVLKHIAKRLLFVFTLLWDGLNILTLPKSKGGGGIAIVKLDAIGDFILWLDSAKYYKEIYPGTPITLIANAAWAPLAEKMNLVWGRVLPVNFDGLTFSPWYRWKTLRSIREKGFDVVINPTYSRVPTHDDALVRVAGSKEIIGSSGNLTNALSWEVKITNQWYTQLVSADTSPLVELERHQEFLRNGFGINYSLAVPAIPERLDEKVDLGQGSYFVVFPGASSSMRRWPAKKFALLIRKLTQKYCANAVLCGGAADQALCSSILQDLDDKAAINLAGQTTLYQLAEVIRGAQFLISNETVAVHIGAAVGTKTVCILGGGHYGRFVPYPEKLEKGRLIAIAKIMPCFNCNWFCSKTLSAEGSAPCIAEIGVDQVIDGLSTESVLRSELVK